MLWPMFQICWNWTKDSGEVEFLQNYQNVHWFANVVLSNKWRNSFFQYKIGSLHPKMLDAMFGLN